MHNPVEVVAQSVYSAIENEKYLPSIEFDRRGEKATRRPMQNEIAVYNFPQMWGSTALGFSGIGGQAFTMAYTTVLVCGNYAAIFFNGRHAYTSEVTPVFEEDMRRFDMASVAQKGKYLKKAVA